ncbi:MAG TPA: hypothetical protein VI386_04355 [Candidatus Sulfotelmatobacter sp.]
MSGVPVIGIFRLHLPVRFAHRHVSLKTTRWWGVFRWVGMTFPDAEAPLFHGRQRMAVAHPSSIQAKVKGSGQECPLYTLLDRSEAIRRLYCLEIGRNSDRNSAAGRLRPAFMSS